MKNKTIVITGGPGTGKTTMIKELIKEGFCCYPEISRDITLEARKNGIEQLFLENALLFSELLLEGRQKQYVNATREENDIVFLDRGIPDILAYMHYIGDSYPARFDNSCKNHQYYKVFILPPWEDIYVGDEARYENFKQSQLIFEHLKETYQNYGYDLIEVPTGTINQRVDFIKQHL